MVIKKAEIFKSEFDNVFFGNDWGQMYSGLYFSALKIWIQ